MKIKLLGKSTLKQAIKLVTEALAESFREVSKQNDSDLLCSPSHQTVKNRVSDIANLFKSAENERIQKYYEDELHGEKQVEILFEEKDGLFLSIQGQKSKKEIKLAKVYEGWQLECESSKRYKTINPLYCSGYENPEQFDAIINSGIAEVYDSNYLKTKILNCLKHSKQNLGEAIQNIVNRNIDTNLKYDVKSKLDNQLIEAKKDVNNAVREVIYEKPRKFSNKESHIQVFDNKLTQLFKALRGLLEK